jgi:hypothetical protein
LFSLLVVGVLAGQALSANFHIVDDHEILRYIMTPTNIVDVLNQDFASGRSRPLYYILRLAQVALLAVRARHHEIVPAVQEKLFQGFRQREVGKFAVQNRFHSRISSRDGIADHDDIGGGNVPGVEPWDDRHSL